MTMHRRHPDPRVHLPASPATPTLPLATMSYPRAVDVSVCEWTADLSTTPPLGSTSTQTTVGAVAYIDFDALDSVHESTCSEMAVRS